MDPGLAEATAMVVGGSRGTGFATAHHRVDRPRQPVAAFLAPRRNSYMTGANINVDGGSDFT
jgi:NAD(P)-dependent dehydrogenase (short-subunit alcohol dehydrogenase family)